MSLPKAHILKTHPEEFAATRCWQKQFEFRNNDRGFVPGDILVLREFDPVKGYTGEALLRTVDFILPSGKFGVPDGYCCMSIGSVNEHTANCLLVELLIGLSDK